MFNKIYKLKKGKHYSSPINLGFGINKTKMSCAVMFQKDVLGSTKQENVLDWNKLFGFSRGFHQNNSFRFGWREDGDNMFVAPYTYMDGIRYSIEAESRSLKINTDELYLFEIQLSGSKVFYTVSDSRGNMIYEKSYIIRHLLPILGYDLKPYFGGNTTPLKDFSIGFNTKIN